MTSRLDDRERVDALVLLNDCSFCNLLGHSDADSRACYEVWRIQW